MKKVGLSIFVAIYCCFNVNAENRLFTINELAGITNEIFVKQNEKEPEFLKSNIPYPSKEVDSISSEVKKLKTSLNANSIKKDEWETTVAYNKRLAKFQNDVKVQINNLELRKNHIIAEYNQKCKKLEDKKKQYYSSKNFKTITGKYIIDKITLVYKIASIQYNADSGFFDITFELITPNEIKIDNNFSIRCAGKSLKLKESIPDIEAAKKFKKSLVGIVLTFDKFPVEISYDNRCIVRGEYIEKREFQWGRAALDLGVTVLCAMFSREAAENYANQDKSYYDIKQEVIRPAVYCNILEFSFNGQKPTSTTFLHDKKELLLYAKKASPHHLISLINPKKCVLPQK